MDLESGYTKGFKIIILTNFGSLRIKKNVPKHGQVHQNIEVISLQSYQTRRWSFTFFSFYQQIANLSEKSLRFSTQHFTLLTYLIQI